MNDDTIAVESAVPTGAPCKVCGAVGTVNARERELTARRRVKFGALWLIVTVCTGGLGLLLYLVWPRRNVTTGVDRWLECSSCGARVAS